MRDIAVQIAISEVSQPTLGVTEQVLAVHKLAIRDGNLVVLSVDENHTAEAYYIYFQIENELYHFVVVVRQDGEKFAPSASYVEAAVRVYLLISSRTLCPEVISQHIGLICTRSYMVGDAKNPRISQLKFQENHWYFEPQQNVPGGLENKLTFLLDQLEPVQVKIAQLQHECEICICICYEGYRGWMGGWHIDKTTLRKIEALNAEVDLDLYAYGESDLP